MAKKQKHRIVIAWVALLAAFALSCLAYRYLLPQLTETGTASIASHPPETTIQVDGFEHGLSPMKVRLVPGEHLLSVHKEHYLPWEETIVISKAQQLELAPILVFIPYVQELVESPVRDFAWSTDSQELFYLRPVDESELVRLSLPDQQEYVLFSHSSRIDAAAWAPDHNHALLHLSSYGVGPSISLWQADNQPAGLPPGIIGPGWSNDSEKILYIGATEVPSTSPAEDIYPTFRLDLRQSDLDGSEVQQIIDLEETNLVAPLGASWSPDASSALVQGRLGVGIVQIIPAAQTMAWVPHAKAAQWSPDGRMIAFRRAYESGNSLWIADAQGRGETQMAMGLDGPFAWSKDGRIFYFRYSQQEDGSALWAVDPETGNLELLADAAKLPGRVYEFAISPGGKQVAFVGTDGSLSLLVLRE